MAKDTSTNPCDILLPFFSEATLKQTNKQTQQQQQKLHHKRREVAHAWIYLLGQTFPLHKRRMGSLHRNHCLCNWSTWANVLLNCQDFQLNRTSTGYGWKLAAQLLLFIYSKSVSHSRLRPSCLRDEVERPNFHPQTWQESAQDIWCKRW